jgi:Rhodopirellula transposase DDE domain/Helix-turn-helix of DDE superfamily endonuclease
VEQDRAPAVLPHHHELARQPLTSHEVILNSIAATTTRTGLTVRAELDPGSYPTGTEISDAQMAAIPLARHRFHGDWNYTVHPRPTPSPPATGAAEPSQLAAGAPGRFLLSHPALTGMSRRHLDDLVAELAGPQKAQREQSRHQRRGAERRRAAGAGPRPKLTNADRILATVLYLRRLCTQAVLGELFAVDRSRITEAIREIRPLLDEHGHAITPSTARFFAPADLIAFLAAEDAESMTQIKRAC